MPEDKPVIAPETLESEGEKELETRRHARGLREKRNSGNPAPSLQPQDPALQGAVRCPKLTKEIVEVLIQCVEESGTFAQGARQVGISPTYVSQLRGRFPEFKQALDDAKEVFFAKRILPAAVNRAVDGVEEDVWYKGSPVGKRRVYSDKLLESLLAGFKPGQFGKSRNDQKTGDKINIILNVSQGDDGNPATISVEGERLSDGGLELSPAGADQQEEEPESDDGVAPPSGEGRSID